MPRSTLTGLCSPKIQPTRSHVAVDGNVAEFSPVLALQRTKKHANHVTRSHSTRNTTVLTAKRPQLHRHWTNHHCLPEAARRTLPLEHLISHSLTPSTSSYSSSDDSNSSSNDESDTSSTTEAKIDLNLPRRSRLIAFTCNLCNGRSERLVNPVAWDKGLVIVQCRHCEKWHKVQDAANLIDEIRYADLEE